METIGTLFLVIVGLFFYFMPGINALERRHGSASAILVANAMLGWTVLGWILCLVWSFSGHANRKSGSDTAPKDEVRCPECKELVRHDARKCKHCGGTLIPQ